MTAKEYNSYIAEHGTVIAGSPEHLFMHEASQRALKITMGKMNNRYNTPEELRDLISELTGEEVDETFGMFPPFFTDYGMNLHLGKHVFINAGCKFQDQGGIWIGDGALIGHNCMMATINHDGDPENRHSMTFKPVSYTHLTLPTTTRV